MYYLRVSSSGSFTVITIAFLVQEYFSVEVLIVVISVDKWTSRNKTTINRDENSFHVFIALHEMISVFMKLYISRIRNINMLPSVGTVYIAMFKN